MSPQPMRPTDGRLLRSVRSREAIVEALLALVIEGRLPSSADVAERAGVTQRTLFSQFGDMGTLVQEAGRRQGERLVEMEPSTDPEDPLDDRLLVYTSAMTQILEEAMHIRWVLLSSDHPAAADLLRRARAWNRRLLERTFGPELAAVVEPRRPEVLDELEMAVDPVTWRMRRLVQELDTEEARVRMADTLAAILANSCARGRAPGRRAST